MKRRSDTTYFPWLFTASDFLASLVSILIANSILQRVGVFEGAEFSAFLPLSVFWLLISALRKDYKIGRIDEYDFTLRKLLFTVLWFLIGTAILWTPLQQGDIRWIPIAGLGVIMALLMGMFRVTVHLLLRNYRAKGNNYRNAIIVGKGGTSPKLADVFRIRKDFGINFLGYFDDLSDCAQTRGGVGDFFDLAPSLNLDIIYVHEQLEAVLVKKIIDFADENYIKVKTHPGRQPSAGEKSLLFKIWRFLRHQCQ